MLDVFIISAANEEELINISEKIGDNKTPGLGAIPYGALKLAIKTGCPGWIIRSFRDFSLLGARGRN